METPNYLPIPLVDKESEETAPTTAHSTQHSALSCTQHTAALSTQHSAPSCTQHTAALSTQPTAALSTQPTAHSTKLHTAHNTQHPAHSTQHPAHNCTQLHTAHTGRKQVFNFLGHCEKRGSCSNRRQPTVAVWAAVHPLVLVAFERAVAGALVHARG